MNDRRAVSFDCPAELRVNVAATPLLLSVDMEGINGVTRWENVVIRDKFQNFY